MEEKSILQLQVNEEAQVFSSFLFLLFLLFLLIFVIIDVPYDSFVSIDFCGVNVIMKNFCRFFWA
jgi:hypothetical protein